MSAICYAVGIVCRFMSKPKWSHYQDAVKILRYVKGTLKHGILFPSRESDDVELVCYSNSDWCRNIVDKMSIIRYRLMIYNKSYISLAKNPVFHGRSKNINTKYHFMRDQVHNGALEVVYINTHKQLPYMLTNAIKTEYFINSRNGIGVVDF